MTAPAPRSLLILVIVIAAAAGCVVQPRGFVHEEVPDVKIITTREAVDHRLRGEPMQHSFGPGRDGTDVVVDFLAAARARGAGWVSSLAIHLASTDGGRILDCVTYLGPEEEIVVRNETVTTPGRTEWQRHLRPVTRMRSRSDRECRMVQRPHTTTKTEYRYEYDYISKRSRSVPHTRTVTEYRSEQECHHVSRMVPVTTYEYQTEMKWVPPRTEVIARRYSHWNLVESRPTCAPLAGGQSGQNRVEGVVYYPPEKSGEEKAAR